jgi:hypothetical protein
MTDDMVLSGDKPIKRADSMLVLSNDFNERAMIKDAKGMFIIALAVITAYREYSHPSGNTLIPKDSEILVPIPDLPQHNTTPAATTTDGRQNVRIRSVLEKR